MSTARLRRKQWSGAYTAAVAATATTENNTEFALIFQKKFQGF